MGEASKGQVPDAVPSGSINRALVLLVALARHEAQGLSELSAATGLAKPTLLRFLRIFEEEGFARRTAAGAWAPTTRMWQLGCSSIDYDHVGRGASVALREVVEATGETAVYALYEDGYTVYVEQVAGVHAIRSHIAPGSRVPATATATGRCMLAHQSDDEIARVVERDLDAADRGGLVAELERVREAGHAFNQDGLWPNVWGIGAPVRDRHLQVVGAIGVSGPTDRLPDDLEPVVIAVRAGADRITESLGGFRHAGAVRATDGRTDVAHG